MFEQQLLAWAALPVAQKFSAEAQAAAQAVRAQQVQSAAKTLASQGLLPDPGAIIGKLAAQGIHLRIDEDGDLAAGPPSLVNESTRRAVDSCRPGIIELLRQSREVKI